MLILQKSLDRVQYTIFGVPESVVKVGSLGINPLTTGAMNVGNIGMISTYLKTSPVSQKPLKE